MLRRRDGFGGGDFMPVWLSLSGEWRAGGIVMVRFGKLKREIELPPLLFAVLAVLALTAKRAKSDSKSDSWVPREFRTKQEIRAELRRHGIFVEPDRIVPIVLRLREKFESAYGEDREGDGGYEWARRMIQSSGQRGYRLAVRAQNLKIDIRESGDPFEDFPPRATG